MKLSKISQRISPLEKARIDIKMKVAVLIADALKQRKMSQTDFARLVGKDKSTVSAWLSGDANLTLDTISLIETSLEVNIIAEPSIDREAWAKSKTTNKKLSKKLWGTSYSA